MIKSKKGRNTAQEINRGDLDLLVLGNTNLALDLYRTLIRSGNNLIFSPYSIVTALAMAFAGARGNTEKTMAQALSFHLPQATLHAAFNYLELQIKSRREKEKEKNGTAFHLHTTNALWGQKGVKFLPGFLDVLAQNYGTGLLTLDFAGETEKSRKAINKWASEQTEGKISDLVPQGAIDQLTRLVLTNAVYFKARWASPFNKRGTSDEIFHLADDNEINVPMMHRMETYRYAGNEEYQAVELPYRGGEMAMVVLLPAAGRFQAVETGLKAAEVQKLIDRMEAAEVNLYLPRFRFESSFSLKEALERLGMKEAFSSEADFSGMNGGFDLAIREILHKAFVAADEEGTEAAAATVVMMVGKSMPLLVTEMKVDRPFIFFIRDTATGSIIFLGRVLDPRR